MSDTTKIEWADATFNPWIGCTKVSPGCANCYAENTTRARVLRSQGHETWGKGKQRSRTSVATWKQPLRWNKTYNHGQCSECQRLYVGCNVEFANEARHCSECSGEVIYRRRRIFPSLCDWLDDEVPIEWLADFLKLIYETPHLDWLLLTKRPENWRARIEQIKTTDEAFAAWLLEWLLVGGQLTGGQFDGYEPKPPANVWVGTSVEDQTRADERIPELLKIPAAVRFISCEPLLGPIRFRTPADFIVPKSGQECGVHWVIVGGESGARARMCHVSWVRSIVLQCRQSGVVPFVKQLGKVVIDRNDAGFDGDKGEWPMGTEFEEVETGYQGAPVQVFLDDEKGGDIDEWPDDLGVREFPAGQQKVREETKG